MCKKKGVKGENIEFKEREGMGNHLKVTMRRDEKKKETKTHDVKRMMGKNEIDKKAPTAKDNCDPLSKLLAMIQCMLPDLMGRAR